MTSGAAPRSVVPSLVADPTLDLIWIPGGMFRMGSDRHYPEEAPAHRVAVDGFWMDRTPVTNRQFRRFVEETGYVTVAEQTAQKGSLVFTQPGKLVDLRDWTQWWVRRPGADWRHPSGPNSCIDGYEDHPVVHVAYRDAEVYACWAGTSLPTEAEWEFAARGGLEGAEFAWGNVFQPCARYLANTWQGAFPHQNLRHDGYERTSPVTAFPPNGYALYDMIGNVWEWTSDWYAKYSPDAAGGEGISKNPRGGHEHDSYDPREPALRIPRKVLKGGSHLCAPNYSLRYRPAARLAAPADTSASDIGFRCVVRKA
jgi:formylglycine-generating enzyme required for sulfatase activity